MNWDEDESLSSTEDESLYRNEDESLSSSDNIMVDEQLLENRSDLTDRGPGTRVTTGKRQR
jgi:hypothetical protein